MTALTIALGALIGATAGLGSHRVVIDYTNERAHQAIDRVLSHRTIAILATASLAASTVARFGWQFETAVVGVLVVALVAITLTDLTVHLIPDRIILPLTIILVALMGLAAAIGDHYPVPRAIIGAATIVTPTMAIHLLGGSGFGDVKLAIPCGLTVGWLAGAPIAAIMATLAVLLIAFGGVAVTGLASRRSHVPMGPWLAIGTLIVAGLLGPTGA